MATPIDVLLTDLNDRVGTELTEPIELEDCDNFPSEFFAEKRKWKRIEDVVVVFADLANSTKLGFDKYVNSSASIYEAATGGAVRCLTDYSPNFVDIQGDGAFALFHGERCWEGAFCAAVTVKTFSELHLVPLIEKHHPKSPATGFRVGMAAGTLAVKRVGVRGTNEPVWAGKPVNWAAKCAGAAEIHELVVTERVWNKLKGNDYVRWACGCNGGTSDLWSSTRVSRLPSEDWTCFALRSQWCINCGTDFCQAILDGQTTRDDLGLLARMAR